MYSHPFDWRSAVASAFASHFAMLETTAADRVAIEVFPDEDFSVAKKTTAAAVGARRKIKWIRQNTFYKGSIVRCLTITIEVDG